ncbi:unnamed protein product [Brassicogethes aeneus]|uniref:Uncharacterized protein n=1 Tax=Brassicogethes aeneus TaxID=1431903 RepID=A0A9P0B0C9_BRAAE|nr:unnamed protein product [Brassicogethes aeneus]
MGETGSDHQLWVNLSALGDGNVFGLLPDLMKRMLSDCDTSDVDDEYCDVILPSDDEWRTKVYYKLVERQRLMDDSEKNMLDHLLEEKNVKLHEWNIRPKTKVPCEPPVLLKKKKKHVTTKSIPWTVSDIAKAGCLLQTPPINTQFDDEQEMRRLVEKSALVWLLLYDLYHRSFNKRETKVQAIAAKLFDSSGLSFVENALWTQRIKLAAAVSRLRIKNNALSLSELLPPHLQDERVSANEGSKPVTCWVNTIKDRSFCLGPATFDKLVNDLELTGSVIQTHVNSPRSTAYLAVLLSHNEKIKKLLAFSAGQRKDEYQSYFNDLGMNNILIFSERLIDTHPDASYMEEVVAVFATPPNSYSAVSDPIDLVCSRGGDLSMLQVLTESEDTKEGRERVASVLDEQRKTLRFAMSRPQIQFVLYETHSELHAENKGMVVRALNDINKIAKIHHAALQGKLTIPIATTTTTETVNEINNNTDKAQAGDNLQVANKSSILLKTELSDETILDKIKVPDTDIFDVPNLPMLCPSEQECANLPTGGCFLQLLQRKQIIKLDDKYMIQMAEHRGLFGTPSTGKSKSSKSKKKVEEEVKKPPKTKKKLKDNELERIAAPTHTFLNHICRPSQIKCCNRCEEIQSNQGKETQFHKWWGESTRHIIQAKQTLTKRKIIPPHLPKIDEYLAKAKTIQQIPLVPRLRLTRVIPDDKVNLPLTVTNVEFNNINFTILKR